MVNTQIVNGNYRSYPSASRHSMKETFLNAKETAFGAAFSAQEKSAGTNSESATTGELYYQKISVLGVDKISQIKTEEKNLGIGFLLIGDYGYGMSAKQIIHSDSNDVMVQVKITIGEKEFETYDVNLSEVDPGNATAIEMFALCQYADANGAGVNCTWGSWHALKEFSTPFEKRLDYTSLDDAVTKKSNWTKALSQSVYYLEKESTGEKLSAKDVFKMLKEIIIKLHKLTVENIKKKDDWREMDDEQWDKLLEHIDKYIDEYKEELKEKKKLQEEAAMKAAAKAPADKKVMAASRAALDALVHGFTGGADVMDEESLEKLSWTYSLETENQVILAKAKMANEFASDMLSKSQELALTGDTSAGISESENMKECARVIEDDTKKKVWTITAFTAEGIICKECSKDGVSRELWRIDYKKAGDAEKVWKFLDRFDKDEELQFASSKSFWEDFLAETSM